MRPKLRKDKNKALEISHHLNALEDINMRTIAEHNVL